jgi:hypothetical protein
VAAPIPKGYLISFVRVAAPISKEYSISFVRAATPIPTEYSISFVRVAAFIPKEYPILFVRAVILGLPIILTLIYAHTHIQENLPCLYYFTFLPPI